MVHMLLVDKFLSTQHFVDTTFRLQTFRRHDTSSKFFCRHKHAEVEELLRVLNFFKFQTIQLLYLGSEGEGDNYKTTSDKVRLKAKIFKLDHTKWGWGRKSGARINDFHTTKIFCRQNIMSTKCSVDEMLVDKNLSTKCFSTKVSFDERHRIQLKFCWIFFYIIILIYLKCYTFDQHVLKLAPVTVGHSSVLTSNALVLSGSTLCGQNRILPWTLVMKNDHLHPNTKWSGVPAQQII
jgi:hypothetical protein